MSIVPFLCVGGIGLFLAILLWIDNQHDKKQAKLKKYK